MRGLSDCHNSVVGGHPLVRGSRGLAPGKVHSIEEKKYLSKYSTLFLGNSDEMKLFPVEIEVFYDAYYNAPSEKSFDDLVHSLRVKSDSFNNIDILSERIDFLEAIKIVDNFIPKETFSEFVNRPKMFMNNLNDFNKKRFLDRVNLKEQSFYDAVNKSFCGHKNSVYPKQIIHEIKKNLETWKTEAQKQNFDLIKQTYRKHEKEFDARITGIIGIALSIDEMNSLDGVGTNDFWKQMIDEIVLDAETNHNSFSTYDNPVRFGLSEIMYDAIDGVPDYFIKTISEKRDNIQDVLTDALKLSVAKMESDYEDQTY